jgi:two-component system sensor histidine kinase/response regulator
MNDHVSKPIDPAMLFETVRRFCKSVPTAPAGPTPPQESKAEAPALAEDLPIVVGLDTKDGLARVAGNKKLYLKLLRQFVEQQKSAVEQISAVLAQGDTAVAGRLAHTTKGVAGNIGAKTVQAAAGEVEKLIRNQAEPAALELAQQRLAAALSPLIQELERALLSSPPLEAPGPAAEPLGENPERIHAVAEQLLKLLSDFDPEASGFAESNRNALRSLLGSEVWPEFEKLVQSYGFTQAQSLLEKAMNSSA